MRRRTFISLLVVVALVALTAALATADEHVAQVSVGHGIPGTDVGQDDDALPVDVAVNGVCEVEGLEFGHFAGPLDLDPGAYTVAVHLAGDGDPCGGEVALGPVDLEFEGGTNVTIFAHLTADGAPAPPEIDPLGLGITASVFENDVSDAIAGHTRLTVRHTAWAPAVDVLLNRGWIRGRLIGEIEGLENPDEEQLEDLRPGAYAITILPADGEDAVYQTSEGEPFVTHPHRSQIVYAVGSLENDTFTLMVQLLDLGHTPPPRPEPPR